MWTQLPSPKRGRSPQFSAHVYCGQTPGWIKMALGMELGLGPGHIMLDGDLAPIPKRGQSPQIFGPLLLWPNGCIRIPLGTEVGPSLRHTVLDRDIAPPPLKGHSPPIFGQCPLWSNGWMDQDATWYGGRYGGRPRPTRQCVRSIVYCGQTPGWIKMALGMELGLRPGHIVLDGDPAPLPKEEAKPPQFSAHSYCDQTAGCHLVWR